MENVAFGIIVYLMLVPFFFALIQLLCYNDKARSFITVVGALAIAFGSLFLAIEFLPAGTQALSIDETLSESISFVSLGISVLLCFYIIFKGIYHHKYLAVLLAFVQLLLVAWFEIVLAPTCTVVTSLYIDNLSIIMALIIGIIGSGITVYALGYMRDHEAHSTGPNRSPIFFSVMFAFLGAMFGIVFFNNMAWMLCAWEITTVCSFALIAYTRTDEAIKNSFLQIVLNLIGGIAFSVALIISAQYFSTLELSTFITMVQTMSHNGLVQATYLPLLLLALAAFTKAAQMPFHSWLLGAMVAPTPTSALLHSSTMVKAGVFLLIKLSPCFGYNMPGFVVMMVGGATFLFAAIAAISQTNAKRVLAYSTISNLGLITACAGVGTDGALWAAIFLLIFHACAKSLLFLCVGTAEHHVGSRDIESFDDLFERMPRLARLMAIGIMGMFIAPFGMLVSKWAALQAFADSSNILLIMFVVFGSAATFMFWAKWLGKILAIANSGQKDLEMTVSGSEWAAMSLMTLLTVGCCIGFPLISTVVVLPYLAGVFNEVSNTISAGDLWIMAAMGLVVAVIFLGFSSASKKRLMPVYMAGIEVDSAGRSFKNSFGKEMLSTQRNWYMNDLFPEKKVTLIGWALCLALIVGSGTYAFQTVIPKVDTIEESMIELTVYSSTKWANSNEYETFDEYYQYYGTSFDDYKDEYAEMGFSNVGDLMNEIYNELYESEDESESEDAQESEDVQDEGSLDADDSGDSTAPDSSDEGEE